MKVDAPLLADPKPADKRVEGTLYRLLRNRPLWQEGEQKYLMDYLNTRIHDKNQVVSFPFLRV